MKALVLLLAVAMALVATAGCGGADEDSEAEALALLHRQLELLEEENIGGFLATLHPDSPRYADTRAAIEPVFELYELDFELESVEVLTIDAGEARLRAVQVTRKVSGPELADTRLTAVHTLRKTSNGWKLYDSAVESTEVLVSADEEAPPA